MDLTIRYIPATTLITRPDWKTFLLRGEAVPGINEYYPVPTFVPGTYFAGDLAR